MLHTVCTVSLVLVFVRPFLLGTKTFNLPAACKNGRCISGRRGSAVGGGLAARVSSNVGVFLTSASSSPPTVGPPLCSSGQTIVLRGLRVVHDHTWSNRPDGISDASLAVWAPGLPGARDTVAQTL